MSLEKCPGKLGNPKDSVLGRLGKIREKTGTPPPENVGECRLKEGDQDFFKERNHLPCKDLLPGVALGG